MAQLENRRVVDPRLPAIPLRNPNIATAVTSPSALLPFSTNALPSGVPSAPSFLQSRERDSLQRTGLLHAVSLTPSIKADLTLYPRQYLTDYDKRGKRPGRSSFGKSGKNAFPDRPQFSERVKECIPLAVERVTERPRPDEWATIEPRSPKNRVVTLDDGERRVVGRKGQLLPLYRDWEKLFGKPGSHARRVHTRVLVSCLEECFRG